MKREWLGRAVLVTGATGFIGSNLALRLLQLGATVYGTSRAPSASSAAIHWVQADLTDVASVRSAIKTTRPDVIFHLAGQTSAALDRNLVIPTLQSNLVSTVLLALEALELGVPRIVVTGSLEEPSDFDQGTQVLSPYGISKWASVVYARLFAGTYGLPVSIVRIYMAYGPRQNQRKLIPYVVLHLLEGKAPTVS